MDILFRTLGPWGPGIGRNLHAAEVDSNFWELGNAIVALQNDPTLPNGIANISVSGTQMTITLADGEVMGPFTLPVLVFRWRGPWEPNAIYAVLDVFTVQDAGIFMVQVQHTSGDVFDPLIGDDDAGPYLLQLFGSTTASMSTLSDVVISGELLTNDALLWDADAARWINKNLKSMAFQDASAVAIDGGRITGLSLPTIANEAATKSYVDTAISTGSPANIPSMGLLANINIVPSSASGIYYSDFLDAALGTSTRGAMLYRGATGWVGLAPGTAGYFLKTQGAGADVAWAAAGAGVTSITAGSGIAASPNPLVATGTIALAAVATGTLLANTSGSTTAPTPQTLSALLDAVMSNARGSILMRAGGGWVALPAGTSGYYLKTQGPTADPLWDAPAGTGTVTSISAGAGISTGGAPITGVGTVSLANVANLSMLANTSGGSAAPVATTASLYFDSVFGATQGALLYRNASSWVLLAPGTSGQVLTTSGAAANPSWAAVPASAPIATGTVLGNVSGSTAAAAAVTPSNLFDAVFGSARGMVLYRGAAGWTALAAGTAGQVLTTGGPAVDPSWAAGGGGGASITIGDVLPSSPSPGALHWDSVSGQLFVFYSDGSSSQWVIANSAAAPSPPKYNLGFSYTGGVLGSSQLLGLHRASVAITIPANFGSYAGHFSQAGGTANATGTTIISVDRALNASPNTFSQVGTITIAAASLTPAFATTGGAAISIARGDVIRLVGPAIADSTLANFYCTLVGYET